VKNSDEIAEVQTSADVLESFVLTLSKPLDFGNAKISQLTLREPLMEEFLAAEVIVPPKNVLAYKLALISIVSGVPMSVLKTMRYPDYVRAGAYLDPLFAAGLAGGGTDL